ncbi:hypothetical protein CRM22_004557 [Opisthorchis felineus]|uniref:Phosphatidylinositol-4,5-bisphosphate 4-phosphatase n=2 Tax=Opisthorchiidae TaxID=6196 RepID=A0A8T1M252_CLOSI|nr:Type 2 phosphatidylinositol 4,5-bisphosphate 4-phosphatase [Clonorchis sinensis]TGZ67871.1 hypothetical protein CRM22_004557 [Opisthorchis felineus]
MDEKTPLITAEAPIRQPPSRPVVEQARTTTGDNHATINCQVCNHVVSIENREKQMVVRCPACAEATPIKGPPAGKQYVRCPCNCLLICSTATTRVGCPRPECQKVIVLYENDAGAPPRNDGVSGTRGMLGPYNPGGTFGVPQSLRVACGNCNSPFSVAGDPSNSEARQNALISCLSGGTSAGAAGLIAARCPHCRKVTSVGPAYARVRLVVYGLLTLVALILAIGVTAGTAKVAQENKALYFLWSVLYLVVVVLGLRAVVFLLMPVSSVEVPVLHI